MEILIQLSFVLILGFFLLFFIMQIYNLIFRGFAPFISTKSEVLKEIVNNINLQEGQIVYELGCGKAGFLHALKKRYPDNQMIGFEYSFVPYFLAQIQNAITNSKLKIEKKNIFDVELKKADVVYCYLNPNTMEKLEEVFKTECKPGSLVVSYHYPLREKTVEKVLDVEGGKEKIYFYRY